jgi:hypothetical protein
MPRRRWEDKAKIYIKYSEYLDVVRIFLAHESVMACSCQYGKKTSRSIKVVKFLD